jgi:hypothetical protein
MGLGGGRVTHQHDRPHSVMSDDGSIEYRASFLDSSSPGTQSSAVLVGTHCHLHVSPVPHVSESSPSAVLQRRLIPSPSSGISLGWTVLMTSRPGAVRVGSRARAWIG